MHLTNKMRLPEPIVKAISNDSYTKGDADISVTELLMPPQIRHLRKQHASELTEDASDRIWSLLGQAVHSIIERSSDGTDTLSEVTLTTELNGSKIKGTLDHITISSAEMVDFKVTTVWKLLNNQVPEEWEEQTNIYRWMLMREKGIDIASIAIIAILRDWSKREADRRSDYPQAQCIRLEVPLWSPKSTEFFVAERLAAHMTPDYEPCSDEDIWAKPSKWAVMKRGRTSAVKLCDSKEDAEVLANSTAGGYVEYRAGEAIRCKSYCNVSSFCEQWKNDPRNNSIDFTKEFFSEV
jgi:hypothetical protein